jgi:hypothetical protein
MKMKRALATETHDWPCSAAALMRRCVCVCGGGGGQASPTQAHQWELFFSSGEAMPHAHVAPALVRSHKTHATSWGPRRMRQPGTIR